LARKNQYLLVVSSELFRNSKKKNNILAIKMDFELALVRAYLKSQMLKRGIKLSDYQLNIFANQLKDRVKEEFDKIWLESENFAIDLEKKLQHLKKE
jgi:hypothetical protein